MRLDHVNIASRDFEATAARLRDRLGLGVEPFPDRSGGHVPLADRQYIEIHTQASPSFGAFIARVARHGDRWWTWSVEVDDLPPQLARSPFDSRDGSAFTQWCGEHAGTQENAASRGLLPYFIRYDTDGLDALFETKRSKAAHDAVVGRITRIVVGPDAEQLHAWLGCVLPEVQVEPSVIGLSSVSVEIDGREPLDIAATMQELSRSWHGSPMRLLFSIKAGSLGHLLPLVPLARAASAAGHDVVFVSGPDRADAVGELGFRFRPVGLTFAEAQAERQRRWPDWPWGGDLVHTFSKVFTTVQAPAAVADLERVVDEERPDVIVCEPSEFSAPVVAAARQCPLVVHGWGLPLPADLVLASGAAARPMWEERGLPAPPGGGMCEAIQVDLCPPSLDPKDGPRRTGPVLPMSPCVIAPSDGTAPRNIAYVTLGTAMFARHTSLFAAAARALARSELDVVITVGPHGDLDAVAAAAPFARVERFVDQDEILPSCAVAVCHGGSGTILGALAHGVPAVVLPLGADQHRNAAAAERIGAARVVDTPDETEVSEALDDVLHNADYRMSCEAIAAEIGNMPSPATVCQELASLVT